MSLPSRAPFYLMLGALIVAALLDVTALLTPSPPSPPPTAAGRGWALTPEDLFALGDRALGIWRPGEPGPILTRSPEPARWMRGDAEAPEVEVLGESEGAWRRLSFPIRELLPPLSSASVSLSEARAPQHMTPCKRLGTETFQCGAKDWTKIEPRSLQIASRQERCVWAHPQAARTLKIIYPHASPAPKGQRLMLQVAFSDQVTGDNSKPVSIALRHGQRTTRHTAHTTRKGWQRFGVTSGAGKAPLEIEFTVAQAGRHHMCYRLALEPLLAAPGASP